MTAGRTCAGCWLVFDEMEFEVICMRSGLDLLDDHCGTCRRRQFGKLLGEMEGQLYLKEIGLLKRRLATVEAA